MKVPLISGGIAMCLTLAAGGETASGRRAARIPAKLESDSRAVAKDARLAGWRDRRFGLFIHWGPYSELGGTWEGKVQKGNTEWIMRTAAIPLAAYRDAAGKWDPEAYDPQALVAFAKRCGFKYIVMTAKHYDGFALFDSKASDFDAVDVLPSKRDLLKEFSKACKDGGMPLGFSYALDRDWYHPGGNTLGSPWDASQAGSRDIYLEKVALPQLRELADGYGPVFSLLADAGPGIPPRLAPLFREALGPEVVTASAFAGDPDYLYTDGLPLDHAVTFMDWEKCTCLGNSWGFRKGAMGYQSPDSILRELVSTVSKGGNYLLNVGLDGEGKIPDDAAKVLEATGDWLSKYGESIYGTSKSPFVVHPWDGVATLRNEGEKGATLYLHLFGKQQRGKISLESLLTEPQEAEVMGSGQKLSVTGRPGRWEVDLSGVEPREAITVLKVKLPSFPVLGPGSITADKDGRFRLELSKGTYADSRTVLGRTAESTALQLTSFMDPSEPGTWEVYAEAPVSLQLNLRSLTGAPEDKSLLLWVNDQKTCEARALPSEGSSSPAFQSPPFQLQAGTSRIKISGGESDQHPVQISISKIELVPAN